MKILFAASEVDPIIKVGGIADVIGSLGKEIKNAGHDIRIVIPFYQVLKKKKLDSLKNLGSFKVKIDRKIETVNIFQTELDRKIPVYLLEHEKYLSQGKVYLDSNDFSSVARFLFFSVSVLKIFKTINWQPDIIHAHDWQTGLIPVLAKLKKSDFKILFTIHNLLIQGSWNHKQVLKFLGLKGDETPTLKEKISGAYGDDFNLMQQAILNADIITTVSPSYAQEIKTKDYFFGNILEYFFIILKSLFISSNSVLVISSSDFSFSNFCIFILLRSELSIVNSGIVFLNSLNLVCKSGL